MVPNFCYTFYECQQRCPNLLFWSRLCRALRNSCAPLKLGMYECINCAASPKKILPHNVGVIFSKYSSVVSPLSRKHSCEIPKIPPQLAYCERQRNPPVPEKEGQTAGQKELGSSTLSHAEGPVVNFM